MNEIQLPNDIYEIIPSINIIAILLYILLGVLIAVLIYCLVRFIKLRPKKQEVSVFTKEEKIQALIQSIRDLDTSSLDDKTYYQRLSFMFRYIMELYFEFPATNYTYLELKPHINTSFFDTKVRSQILSFFSTTDSIMFNPSFVANSEDKSSFKDQVLSWSLLIEKKLEEDKRLEEEKNREEKRGR